MKLTEYMTKVIAVFDIGKTNKKILLFDQNLQMVFQHEERFPTITDDDGFECDDIGLIEKWVVSTLNEIAADPKYVLTAVNFSTYGATLVFLDREGKRITPLFNYLKAIPENVQNTLFEKYEGKMEFCRKTASPALGMLLNTGIQILWLKNEKPETYLKVDSILNFPQYLSFLFTKKKVAESTYLGCHTFLWDFDQNCYHRWLEDENINLPVPIQSDSTFEVKIGKSKVEVGVGIHDSSASLVPYLLGIKEKFVLLSTGTWCVSMNPFNETPLTAGELANNCLKYLSAYQKPVKSTMYFMGHIHDVNVEHLQSHFKKEKKAYQQVELDFQLSKKIFSKKQKIFFNEKYADNYVDLNVDLSQFGSFEMAYHQFMHDLTLECVRCLSITLPENDDIESLIVTGGFARNRIFIQYLTLLFPYKKVFTSEIDNASALGAAMVCSAKLITQNKVEIDLGLKKWNDR